MSVLQTELKLQAVNLRLFELNYFRNIKQKLNDVEGQTDRLCSLSAVRFKCLIETL